jgi:hypothetical protein
LHVSQGPLEHQAHAGGGAAAAEVAGQAQEGVAPAHTQGVAEVSYDDVHDGHKDILTGGGGGGE